MSIQSKIILSLLMSLTAISTIVYAGEIEKTLAKCAAMEGSLARLDCYDSLAKKNQLNGPQAQPIEISGLGGWKVSKNKNPIDDTQSVVIFLEAETGRSRWGRPVVFAARCQSNKTEAYINWNDFLGDDSSSVYEEWKYVTIRIGAGDAEEQKWNISTDKRATFAPEWAGSLLKKMASADSFLAQVTPFGESPLTAIFDTRGMSAALMPLAETCGWSIDGSN